MIKALIICTARHVTRKEMFHKNRSHSVFIINLDMVLVCGNMSQLKRPRRLGSQTSEVFSRLKRRTGESDGLTHSVRRPSSIHHLTFLISTYNLRLNPPSLITSC